MRLAEPLRGPRLTLRSLGRCDAGPPYLSWMNDPRVTQYLEARHRRHDRASLEAFIEGANADPATLLLGIVLTAEARHIGNIKLGIDASHRRGDIGILIGDTSVWGRGYATEAITVLTAHAFGALGLHKVTAGFYAGNHASIRAFEKAGFRQEARLRHHWHLHGSEDGVLMGLINTTPCQLTGRKAFAQT